jgi:prepilin-type N-terminal cleavage/methylation domain-containing protein
MFSFTDPVFGLKTSARYAFSLIELMIVVAILGALVMIIIPAFGTSEQSAKDDVVIAEMRQLREAFGRFYSDTYPTSDDLEYLTTYGLWPLFTTNALPSALESIIPANGYDPANALGWRGPYALMEKRGQTVYLQNGQPKDTASENGAGTTDEIPVALDPYGGYYRVMAPNDAPSDLYLVCTGPDRTLETKPTSIDTYGRLTAPDGSDDTVLPLLKP